MVGWAMIFMLMLFSFSIAFDNLPQNIIKLKPHSTETINYTISTNETVPVFGENMRFNHNLISYVISKNCDQSQREEMISAFNIFSENVKIVSFFEDGENSDISVNCSTKFVKMGSNFFAAGEGGPSKIINASNFEIIKKGRIILYSDEQPCNYPVVELHELGHVFGFAHSKNPKDLMYYRSNCDQRMSNGMITTIKKLYSIPALGDVKIETASGIIKGHYLKFNISVINDGLVNIKNINLTVLADGEQVYETGMGEIKIGYSKTISVENIGVPRNTKKVYFIVDSKNNVKELNENNNVIVLQPSE